VSEENEVSARHPELVKKLLSLADAARKEIGDDETDGVGQREPGWVEKPAPRLINH
jgi:hypothetical protein